MPTEPGTQASVDIQRRALGDAVAVLPDDSHIGRISLATTGLSGAARTIIFKFRQSS